MIMNWKSDMEQQQEKMKAVLAMKKALESKVKTFVDDMLAASGLSKPPVLQKIYWAVVEGAIAIILISSAEEGSFQSVLKGLRSVSICAGFPLTILWCLMVPSTLRALKHEYGEKEILNAK